MKFTMRGLTRSLAGCLAPHLPNAAFYDNPNQQGTKLPAMFLQRTRAKITMKMGGRFLRRLGLDLVYLVDYNQVDMDDQYTRRYSGRAAGDLPLFRRGGRAKRHSAHL